MNRIVWAGEHMLAAEGFMPHGMCYRWQPDVLGLNLISDALISLAYFVIPVMLFYLVRKRADWHFNWIFICFGIFIIACGVTHLAEIWTIWYPTYWLSGGIKAFTALASIATSILLLKLMPDLINMPSPFALRAVNVALEREIGERSRAEENLLRANKTLESGVIQRTAELEALNRILSSENQRFAMAADAAGLGFWSRDVAADTLQWDERMFQLYGLPPGAGELPGAFWGSCLHPDDRARCLQASADARLMVRPLDHEFRVVHPNGEVRHLRAVARCTSDAQGRAQRMFGVSFDITDRKRADEQFHLAIEAAPTGMLMIDRSGIIVLVNAQVEKLFGYRRDELLGLPVERLVPERFRSHHPDLRGSFFADPQTRAMGEGRELFGLRKDGGEVPIEIGLNPLRTSAGDFVLSSIADISERKRATEHFRLAIEAAPTGMLMMNSSGSIVLVNAQIESLFGYSRAELLGRPVEMLVPERFRARHPEFRKEFFNAPMVRAMGSGGDLYGLRKDGSEVPVEIGLNPLRTADGEFVLSSIVDLSHRNEIDRMRTDFVSTVSHELRTPLTSISGSLGLLAAGAVGTLPDKAAAMVRIAYKNSGRLVRIINDILDIGKLEAGKLALQLVSVSVAELLQQAVEINSSYAEKFRVRYVLQLESASDRIVADADRLMQVMTNLLSNAAKFSRPGGAVLIRTRAGSSALRIEVEDSGAGIPVAFQRRVFEPFAQADASPTRRFDGTGLGLSIARKLIEAMGGTIGFTTVIGQGTVFFLELPRTEAPLEQRRSTQLTDTAVHRILFPAGGAAAPSAKIVPKVLYMEDDEDLVSLVDAILAGRAEIVAAHSLQEAERFLSKEVFALVILNQSLPDENGLDLVDRISSLVNHSVPIILLAGDTPPKANAKVAAVLVKSQMSLTQATATILSYLPADRS
jgi:PAS domain S-box-containing protein